jgi:hypothetical protein
MQSNSIPEGPKRNNGQNLRNNQFASPLIQFCVHKIKISLNLYAINNANSFSAKFGDCIMCGSHCLLVVHFVSVTYNNDFDSAGDVSGHLNKL